jgi:hypothetical protein
MNDPHVEVLGYAFTAVDTRHDYSRAGPWQGNLGDFDCRLDGGMLEVRPKDHYADADSARQALEAHLHAWELWSELEAGIRIRFRFKSAKVVDRQPTPGSVTVHVGMAETIEAANSLTVKLGHAEYPPPPPTALANSALVEELLGWVRDLRERQQRLLVVAYLFLTRLEFEYGNRHEAAVKLNVSRPVLDTLGRLSAKNDPSERRKVKGPIQALTETERQWLLAALPRITRQVAEIAAGANQFNSPWPTFLPRRCSGRSRCSSCTAEDRVRYQVGGFPVPAPLRLHVDVGRDRHARVLRPP